MALWRKDYDFYGEKTGFYGEKTMDFMEKNLWLF